MGTYSPFFTLFEDLSYFVKRNIVLVRYLEQKKASMGKARGLPVLPSTTVTDRNNKRPALPFQGNTKSGIQGET